MTAMPRSRSSCGMRVEEEDALIRRPRPRWSSDSRSRPHGSITVPRTGGDGQSGFSWCLPRELKPSICGYAGDSILLGCPADNSLYSSSTPAVFPGTAAPPVCPCASEETATAKTKPFLLLGKTKSAAVVAEDNRCAPPEYANPADHSSAASDRRSDERCRNGGSVKVQVRRGRGIRTCWLLSMRYRLAS